MLTEFVEYSDIYPLDNAVVDTTIKIGRGHKIKLPDDIIASTCIVNNLTLLTRNVDDFKGLAHLKVINPWRLTDTE